MDREKLIRRVVHLSAPLFTVYYLFPPDILGFSPGFWLIIAWAVFMAFESWRLYSKVDVPGMRAYEKERPSAAAWFITGVVIVFLLFPFEYTLPILLGMGLIDPLNGELRRAESKFYPLLPAVFYLLIMIIPLSLFFGLTVKVILASVLTTITAMGAESIRSNLVDDDFLMVVIPALMLAAVFALPF